MRGFLRHILFTSVVFYSLFFAAHIVYVVLTTRYVPANKPDLDWNYIDNINADWLFLGNSRTWVHIDPSMILNKLGHSSYCLAHDGGDVILVYQKLKKYHDDSKDLKKIFLQFDWTFIHERENLYGSEKFEHQFYLNKAMSQSLRDKEGFSKLNYWLPAVSISPTEFLKAAVGYRRADNPNGYHCKSLNWESKIDFMDFDKVREIEDFSRFGKTYYVDSIFEFCSVNNIELHGLILPVSPAVVANISESDYIKRFENLKKVYKTEGELYSFLDYKEFSNVDLFYNHTHLNCIGSQLLTEIIIERLIDSTGVVPHLR